MAWRRELIADGLSFCAVSQEDASVPCDGRRWTELLSGVLRGRIRAVRRMCAPPADSRITGVGDVLVGKRFRPLTRFTDIWMLLFQPAASRQQVITVMADGPLIQMRCLLVVGTYPRSPPRVNGRIVFPDLPVIGGSLCVENDWLIKDPQLTQ